MSKILNNALMLLSEEIENETEIVLSFINTLHDNQGVHTRSYAEEFLNEKRKSLSDKYNTLATISAILRERRVGVDIESTVTEKVKQSLDYCKITLRLILDETWLKHCKQN